MYDVKQLIEKRKIHKKKEKKRESNEGNNWWILKKKAPHSFVVGFAQGVGESTRTVGWQSACSAYKHTDNKKAALQAINAFFFFSCDLAD